MGFNYWLSKKSMEVVSEAPLPPDGSNDDEKWVAKHLWEHNIQLFDDNRYYLHQQLSQEVLDSRRPLRAPTRPKPMIPLEPEYLSRCIHICAEQNIKIEEFYRVFARHGEKR
jgi:hypothetical protein